MRGITRAVMQSPGNHFWKSRISITTKLKLYNTCILPIFLYGSECWAITKVDALRIAVSISGDGEYCLESNGTICSQ